MYPDTPTPPEGGTQVQTPHEMRAAATLSARPPGAPPGPPGYELLDEVGRGGMGAVYRARDRRLDRDVAVKLLRDDFPTDSPAARQFVEEARITGRLAHPGVPPVHEVGTLPDGRPFLAMKLIRGHTLADLLRARPDPAHDRGRFVAIFEQVCQAVGYAHAGGVIHRDLKPGNVMVGSFGEVQVMDWGLAKEMASRASHGTGDAAPVTHRDPGVDTPGSPELDSTRPGAVLGTPAYMPPEQAAGATDRVDQRSDVFGLGAILCTILTGHPPYRGTDPETTRALAARAGLDDAFTRLDACGADPDLVALCRRCLSADRAARPADAGEVAAAVAGLRAAAEERARQAERNEAEAKVRVVEERKRRRVLLASAAAVTAVLVAGTAVSVWQAVRATTAEGAARTERDNARTAEGKAREEEGKARAAEARAVEREKREKAARETAEGAARFMRDVFTQGGSRSQASLTRAAAPRLTTVRQAMDSAARNIAGRFAGRPEVEAAVRGTIGMTYYDLGAFAEAEEQLDRALALLEAAAGPDHPDTLGAVENLALLYESAGRLADADRLHGRAVAGFEAALGPDDPETLTALNNLAILRLSQARAKDAEALFQRILAVREKTPGPDHPDTLGTVSNLAFVYQSQGRYADAEPLYRRALAGLEKAFSPTHPDALTVAGCLGYLHRLRGNLPDAEATLKRVLAGWEAVHGPDHPTTAACAGSLAAVYEMTGRYADAESHYKRALAGHEKGHGPDHHDTLTAVNNLAGLYETVGRYADAEPLYKRALAGRTKVRGPDHPDTLTTVYDLGFLYRSMGRPADAEPLYKRALAGREAALTRDHPSTVLVADNLALLYFEAGRYAEAAPLYRQAAEGHQKWNKAGPALIARTHLGLSLLRSGRAADAEPYLLASYEEFKKREARLNPVARTLLREITQGLVEVYETANRPEKVAEWRAKVKNLLPEVAPPPRPVR